MYLIQILLPLYNKKGKVFPAESYDQIKKELSERFGGLTAYTRSPASGIWKKSNDQLVKDDILVYEVMTDQLDKTYWSSYRKRMETIFEQESLVIRSLEMTKL